MQRRQGRLQHRRWIAAGSALWQQQLTKMQGRSQARRLTMRQMNML